MASKSRNEFFGRSNSKIANPATLAACQSRSGSSPTCRTSLGGKAMNFSARRKISGSGLSAPISLDTKT